jgi:hypothetical protein
VDLAALRQSEPLFLGLDAIVVRGGPSEVAFGIDGAAQVVVEIAALGHALDEAAEQSRAVAMLFEPGGRCRRGLTLGFALRRRNRRLEPGRAGRAADQEDQAHDQSKPLQIHRPRSRRSCCRAGSAPLSASRFRSSLRNAASSSTFAPGSPRQLYIGRHRACGLQDCLRRQERLLPAALTCRLQIGSKRAANEKPSNTGRQREAQPMSAGKRARALSKVSPCPAQPPECARPPREDQCKAIGRPRQRLRGGRDARPGWRVDRECLMEVAEIIHQ